MESHDIPGTTIFGAGEAQKGFALNQMCFSFNSAENRAAFLKDEDAYCAKYGLTRQQREAVRERNVLRYYARSIQHLLSPAGPTH